VGELVVDVTVGDGVFLEEVGDALEDGCFHSDEKEMKNEKCKVKNSKLIVFTCPHFRVNIRDQRLEKRKTDPGERREGCALISILRGMCPDLHIHLENDYPN
jgi:hypothetical protein